MNTIFLFSREKGVSFFEGRRIFVEHSANNKNNVNYTREPNLLKNKKEEEEDKKKQEQEAQLLSDKRDEVKTVLQNIQNGGEKSIKEYYKAQKKYGSLLTDVINKDLNKESQAKIKEILAEDKKKYKKNIDDIKYHLKTSNAPFNGNHLKAIAGTPIIVLLQNLDSTSQKNKFLRLFGNIDESEISGHVRTVYESLAIEIGVLMEDESISNTLKIGIFQKYIRWKCIADNVQLSNQKTVIKEVITEENIENNTLIKNLLKNTSQEINNVTGLESALRNEDDENGQDAREKKMYSQVEKVLGTQIAKSAENAMEQHSKENSTSRMKAFFEAVKGESWQKLKRIGEVSINQVKKSVQEIESVCNFIIDDFPGLPLAEKTIKKQNLQKSFSVYYDYLEALREHQDKNDNTPLIKFFYQGGDNEATKESFRKLNVFSKQEAYMAFELEKERKMLQKKCVKEFKKYNDAKERINGILNNERTTAEEKRTKLTDSELLTTEGLDALLNEEDFKPWYFREIKNIQNEYGFNDSEINYTLHHSLENSIPESVIETIMKTKKITKTGKIPKNIYTFFTKNRLTTGLETITNEVFNVPQNILEYGDDAGWMDEGDIQEAKNEYSSFVNKEEMQNFLRQQAQKVQNIIEKLTPLANDIPDDEYSGYIASTAHGLKNLLEHIPLDADNETWTSELSSFSTAISNVTNSKDTDGLHSVIGGMKDFKRIVESQVDGLSDTISSIIENNNSTEEQKKNLYNFFEGSVFNKDMQQPSLDEMSWEIQMPLFGLWKDGNGVSLDGIKEVQNLMTKKNEYNEYCIQSRSQFNESYRIDDAEMGTHGNLNVYYYHDKRFIILDDNSYSHLKNFSIEDDAIESVEVELGFIFHETTHSMVEKDPQLLSVFEKLLKNSTSSEEYQRIIDQLERLFADNKGAASAIEELLANVGAMLQFDEERRSKILDFPNDTGHYGMAKPLRKEVQNIFTILGEKKVKELFNNSFNRSKTHKQRVNNNALSTADEGKSDAEMQALLGQIQDGNEIKKEANSNTKIDRTAIVKAGLEEIDGHRNTMNNLFDQLDNAVKKLPSSEQAHYPTWKQAREYEMDKYRNKALFEIETSDDIESLSDDIKNNVIGKIQSKINETAYLNQYPQGGLSQMWNNTTFLSLNDVGKIFTTTWEYIKRRHESKQKRRVGKVGHDMFDGVIDGLANEFQKEESNAENSEVDEIQGGLKNGSDADVVSYVDQVSNQDELKAVLQEQASRGLIQWDQKDSKGDHIYPKILRHLGSNVRFYDSDFETNNLSLLNTKFHKALLQIYGDESLFNTLFQQNKDKITSRIKEGVETANQRGGHIAQLQEWLRMANRKEHVPFHEYEGYISFFVGDGTDDPWQFLYYLLMGIEEGAIPFDALLRFWGDHSNDFPPIDGVHRMSLEKIQDMKKQILPPGSGKDSWDGMPKEFLLWVHANMMTNSGTVERTEINSAGTLPYDHDCAHLLTSIGNADTAVKMLAQGSTGNARFKPTVYNQTVLGMMTNLTSISLYNEKGAIEPELAKETIRRQAGYFGAFDIVSNNRAYTAKKSLFTFKTSALDKKPRGAPSYNGEMNTDDYFKMGRAIYSNVSEPELKALCDNFIFDTSLKANNGKGLIAVWNETISKDSATYPSLTKILGSPLPVLQQDNLEGNVAEIIDAVFTYFLRDAPSADQTIAEITQNSVNVAKGKGLAGVEGSAKWSFKAMEPEKGDIMPESYKPF